MGDVRLGSAQAIRIRPFAELKTYSRTEECTQRSQGRLIPIIPCTFAEQGTTGWMNDKERTLSRFEFVPGLRDVRSFLGILIPALFHGGPHFRSELLMG